MVSLDIYFNDLFVYNAYTDVYVIYWNYVKETCIDYVLLMNTL